MKKCIGLSGDPCDDSCPVSRVDVVNYIPTGTRVITPDGRVAVVSRCIEWDWQKELRAICRYENAPLDPAVSFPPRLLKVIKEDA